MTSFHTSKPTQGDENERNFAVNGTSNFFTDMVFKSVQDLMDWVQNVGRSLGYFIVTRRSNTEPNGVMSKVILMCDRGGIYCQSNKNISIRKGSKKTNCPFHLVGKHVKIYDFWTLRVICEEHNHEPARMEAHPFAMRLSDNETRLVLDLSRKNVKPQHILSILKEHNPNNLSNMRTIYNTLQKFRKANHPETFMGQLFKSDESASPSPTVCAFDANKSKRTIDHTFTFATGNRVQELDSAKYGSLTKDIDNLLLREQMLTPSFRCPSLQADLVETNTHDSNAPNADVMVVSNDNEPKAKRPFVVNSTSDFATDMVFKSRQALMDWVQNVGRSLGYVIITKRSKTDSSGVLSKVTLMCDLGGIYKGNKKSNRNTKKINCPFELVGKYRKMYDIWTLRVICEKHNHEPALAMEGHPYAMRLSEIETCLVRDLSRKNVKPQDILSTLKEQNMNNVSSLKTIYNARQKFRKTGHTGQMESTSRINFSPSFVGVCMFVSETSFIGQRINSEESASSSSTFDANKSKRTIDHTSPFPIKNEVQELDSAKFDSSSSLLYDAYTFDANKSKRTIDHTDPFVIINGVQELDSAKFYAAPSPLYTACTFDGNKSKKTIDETDPCALRNGVQELDSVKHEPVTKDVEGLLLLRKQMSMPSFRRFPSIQADLINPVKDISIANLVRDAFMHDTYAPDVDDIPVSDDEPTSVRLFQPYRGVVLNKTRAQFLMKHFLEEDYAHSHSSSGKGGQETEGECVEESQTNSVAELRDKGEYVGVHSNSNMEENNSQFDVNFDGLADIWKKMTVGFESLKNSKSTSTYYYEGRSDKSGDTDGVVLDGVKSPGKDISVEEVTAHPMHKKQMKPHQVEGFNFLHSNLLSENPGGCILAHTPGSGITFMLISFIHSFMAKYPNARPLVVLPRGILATWQKDFKRWQVEAIPLFDFYSKKAETCAQQLAVLKQWANTRSILFLGHKQFSSIVCDNDRSSVSAICQEILLTYPSLLILDEDHTSRNKGTDVFTSVEKVQTLRKVILSGTLYQNHLREIFNILNLVRPNFLRMEDSKMIKRRILSRVPIENLRNLSEISTDSEFYELVEQLLLKDENFERKMTVINDLREMTSKVLHYYKGDLLDELPDHVDFSVYLNLSPRQKQEVFELRNLARKFEVSSDGSAIYVHPDLKSLVKTESKVKNDDDVYKIKELLEKSDEREGVKAKFFLNLLHLCALTGEKLLVFGQCLLPLKFLLRLTMKVKGWKLNKEIFMITGDHENDEREVAMDQFNNSSDAKVFFGSINSCGEGLTLVGASRIIILDVHLNPSVTRQAIGLAFRPGQVRKLYTYRLIAASSPEEEDHTTCHRKETIAKMWFEYNEYCGQNDFEMEKIDVKGCGDPFLETPWLNEDVTALYKRS